MRVGYCITDKGESYVYNKFKLSTPLEDYKIGDFENRNVHFETDLGAVIVSDDNYQDFFTEKIYKIIKKSIFKLHKKLSLYLSSTCYENAEACYNFMGSDIIFTDDYKIKLLELNKGPGAGTEYHREARFAFFDFFKDKMFDKTKTKTPNIIKLT